MTEEHARVATLDELRNWLAVDDWWNHVLRHRHASGVEQWCWERSGGDESFDHPHPVTLDGADAAIPNGWDWWRVTAEWVAQAAGTPMVRTPDTRDKVADLYRLAVLCRLAMKGEAK